MQGFFDSLGQFLGPIGGIFHYLFYLPVYNVLMVIYEGLNKVIPGAAFGLAIIILTLIIRAALIPLTRKQLSSTRKMQMIQPQLKALQQQYRGDPQTLMAEQRRLYKENGVSMYGGCLPLLVQMPFLYALYGAFYTVIRNIGHLGPINNDLYPFVPHLTVFPQTQFLWANLVQPDPWHILPVVAAVLTFIQMRMALPVRKKPQPGENPDPTSQAMGTTQYIMPLVTLFFGWTFPAGLALYWCVSTGFSAVQQYFINGNFGSLFLGIPGLEHLVPEAKDLTPTTTRQPVAASSGGAARAIVAESPPDEGGIRGWWNRLRESATAAQAQAMERAEQARQEREEAATQARQQAAERDGTTGRSAPPRRQRPTRQGPVLLQPAQPTIGASESSASTGDKADQAEAASDTSAASENSIANGTTGANGSSGKTAKPSSNGASAANGANTAGGASGARNNASTNANGTRSATTGGSNAARKNSPKGGSGGRSGSGRPKRR